MRFPSLRACAVLVLPFFAVTGCNYVHFGRLEKFTAVGDEKVARENSDLRVEKKLLQQELALARKEGDTLRVALESRTTGTGGADSTELANRLNETVGELGKLRASYAQLQAERERLAAGTGDSAAAAARIAGLQTKLGETENRLADTLRTYTQLQEENTRLRAENSALATQVREVTEQNAIAQSALAQLNTELLAQKEIRAKAEQETESLRSQLHTVLAQARMTNTTPTLASARENSASGVRELSAPATLKVDKGSETPPPTATLSVSREKLRTGATDSTPSPAAAPATAPASNPAPAAPTKPVIYVVKDGDSLEKIAKRVYGDPAKWRVLYAANNDKLSGGRPLKPGMELEIPVE